MNWEALCATVVSGMIIVFMTVWKYEVRIARLSGTLLSERNRADSERNRADDLAMTLSKYEALHNKTAYRTTMPLPYRTTDPTVEVVHDDESGSGEVRPLRVPGPGRSGWG